MSTITKERAELKAFITGFLTDPAHDNQSSRSLTTEVFRIALASLEAEAVTCPKCNGTGMADSGGVQPWGEPINVPCDCTAPPAPVSDEDLLHMAASAIDDLLSNKDRSGAGVWVDIPAKLRRAAMFQGADGNSPVIPDGWVMVPMEPTEDMCDVGHVGIDVLAGVTDENEYYSIDGKYAAKVYRAMIAAAPQWESKS